MKKMMTSLLAIVMLLSLCAGCGSKESAAPAQESQPAAEEQSSGETMVLRLANSHNAEHITSQACQMFADLVNEKTDGRITIECHFAGELGDERSTIEQCQFGGLDFTRVSSGASAEFAPLMNALQMPYEYTSVDHLFEVLDGEIGQEVFETFKDNNLVGITYLHPGSRNFFNAKKEIHTPADMAGMKIRVSDTYVKDGREYHGYKIGRVFDISQTHGKAGVPALSLKDNTPEMDAALRRLLDSSPVPVVTSSTMYQDAVYDPKTQSITVSSRLIDSKIFAALSREIVHAGIHDHGRYPYYTREDCAMDAESVSYMLCRNFGVETPQPDVSRVGQVFDGMEVQDRRGVVDSLQKYFRKLQNDIQREISPQERKQPEQNRPVR